MPLVPRCAAVPWEPEPEPEPIDMNESTRLDRKQPHLEAYFTSVFASQDPRKSATRTPPSGACDLQVSASDTDCL
jgi:hypothetical protein